MKLFILSIIALAIAAMLVSITPTSAANPVIVKMQGSVNSTLTYTCTAAISRGTTNNSGLIGAAQTVGSGASSAFPFEVTDLPNTASAVTYAGQRQSNSASGNCVWPYTAPTTAKGMMYLTEIMG
ncbi:hypothetical protein [Bradyrhizobium sp.]|uniref:hypothetical protein n=1 Tax=Bradyrhizobium sp. TaxID=376 RepID=UPI0039E242A5